MSSRSGSLLRAYRSVPGLLADLLLLLLLSLPAIVPLAAEGFLWGHDFEDPPWRSLAIAQSLAEGILFPRWSSDLYAGYGFPIFNFYAPLSYYPAAILTLLAPIGQLDASKITFALALVASGVGAYLLAHELLRHRGAALLAGVLYLYSPAVIGDVYVRANLAGTVSLALLPYVVYAFARLLERPTPALSGVTGLLLGVLILTHNINSAIGLGMMGVYAAFHYLFRRDFRSLPLLLLSLSLGVGLSAALWLPAAGEIGLTRGGDYPLGPHFIDPLGGGHGMYGSDEFLQTSWGPFDLHPAYPYGLPPYKLGLIQGALLLVAGIMLLVSRKRPLPVVSLYAATLLLYYFHTSWSRWLWDGVEAMKLMEFPWRLVRPAGLPLAVAGGWAILQVPRCWRRWLMPSVALVSVLSAMWLAPTDMKTFPFGPVTPEGLISWQAKAATRIGTQVQGQFLPLVVQWEGMGPGSLLSRYGQSYPPEGWAADTAYLPRDAKAWVLSTRKGQNWMEAKVEAAEPTRVSFRTIYFTGWTAYVDGQKVPIEPSSWTEYEEKRRAALGVCQVEVPEGTHLVTLLFEDTPVRIYGNRLSQFSLLVAGLLLLSPLWWKGRAWNRKGLVAAVVLVCVAAVSVNSLLTSITGTVRAQEWVKNGTVFDLLVEAEGKRMRLLAPEGRPADDFIHLRSFTLRGDTRSILYMHPPGSASRGVWVPSGARLEYTVGMDEGVWDKTTDGVEFRIAVREGERLTPVAARRVDPKSQPSDRGWISGSVDLSQFAHRTVELVISTDSVGASDFDWGGWATARIAIE